MHYNEVVKLAQKAWDATKPQSDPVWNECAPQHRQMYLAAAEAVVNTGHAVNDFEHVVKRLAREAEEKQSVVEEVQAEGSGLHSDEIQLEAARRQGLIPPSEHFFHDVPTPADVLLPEKPKRSHRAKPKDDEAKPKSKKSSKKGKK